MLNKCLWKSSQGGQNKMLNVVVGVQLRNIYYYYYLKKKKMKYCVSNEHCQWQRQSLSI